MQLWCLSIEDVPFDLERRIRELALPGVYGPGGDLTFDRKGFRKTARLILGEGFIPGFYYLPGFKDAGW